MMGVSSMGRRSSWRWWVSKKVLARLTTAVQMFTSDRWLMTRSDSVRKPIVDKW